LAERPRDVCDFKGVGHFEAKFWVKGLRFAPISIRCGNGCATTLPLEVFTQRNFVADCIRLNLNVINKSKIAF